MQKIIYLANIRLPTEKAHGLQIMKTCEALASLGISLELIVPRRLNQLKEDPFDFYGVVRNFQIKRLPCLDFLVLKFLGPAGFWLESLSFNFFLGLYLLFNRFEVYYTRDLLTALFLSGRRNFYEVHTLPRHGLFWHRLAWRHSAGLIVISDGLKKALMNYGLPEEKILTARDAVDVAQFQIKETREECRKKLGLPVEQKIVVYTGHLYDWKGAGMLAEAAKFLPTDTHIYLVGGTNADIAQFKEKYQAPNLHIVGWQKHELIPFWLGAAHVLALPNSARSNIGAKYTSPLKAFEYIAAGRAIVASDLPALHEVLNDAGRVVFVEPDSASSLALAIANLLSYEASTDPIKREKELKDYSWETRARRIKDFIFTS